MHCKIYINDCMPSIFMIATFHITNQIFTEKWYQPKWYPQKLIVKLNLAITSNIFLLLRGQIILNYEYYINHLYTTSIIMCSFLGPPAIETGHTIWERRHVRRGENSCGRSQRYIPSTSKIKSGISKESPTSNVRRQNQAGPWRNRDCEKRRDNRGRTESTWRQSAV